MSRHLYFKQFRMTVFQSEGPSRVTSAVERGPNPILSAPAEVEISLLDLLIVIARRKWLIVKIALGLVVIAAVICFLLPDKYTSTTTLLPPQQNSGAGAALLAQLGGLSSMASLAGGNLALKNPNDLEVALLKSETVENAVIDRFRLMDLYHVKRMSVARKKLEAAIDIESGTKDGLIRLSATDKNPQRAAELANGYVEEFKKFHATLAVTEASQRRLFFEQQLGQAKDQLANAEEELKKTEQTTGVLQVDSQARLLIESAAALRGQIVAKQVELQSMRAFGTEENPQIVTEEQEISALKAQLSKLTGDDTAMSSDIILPKGKIPEAGLEYVRKLRDVKYYETIFELLARQYEAAKVDEARQGVEVQIVDKGLVPDHHSSPKRMIILLAAACLGLVIGVIWVLIASGLDRLADDPAENARLQTLKSLLSFRSSAQH